MTDQLDLFVVLVVIYATECVAWIRRSGLALVRGVRRWHVVTPPAALGNGGAGLAFGSLLPTSTMFVVQDADIAWSTEGLVAHDALPVDVDYEPPLPGPLVPYSTARKARLDGNRLMLGSTWTAPSPAIAKRVVHDIAELEPLDDDQRARLLDEHLAAALDPEEVQRRIAHFDRVTGWLNYATTALFAWTFVGAPILVFLHGLLATWRPLLAVFAVLWFVNVIAFFTTHRRLYPKAPGDRWTRILSLTLVPLSAMRTRDHLARSLLVGCNSVVAAVTLAGTFAHPLAHRVLRDLHAPLARDAHDARREHRARILRHLEPTLTTLGVDCAAALAPPPRDDDALAYCPRCQEQYTALDVTCDSCGGQTLVAFTDS